MSFKTRLEVVPSPTGNRFTTVRDNHSNALPAELTEKFAVALVKRQTGCEWPTLEGTYRAPNPVYGRESTYMIFRSEQ